MKTLLITGGAGFVGSHLCEKYLSEGDRVICVDNLQTMRSTTHIDRFLSNKRFTFIKHDVIEPLRLAEHVDWVLDFACSGSPAIYQYDPIHTWKTSTIGTLNTLEFARRHNAKYLFASTSEVYGDPKVSPQPETYTGNVNTVGPRACYDEGKRAAEALIMDYRREYGLDAKLIRIFNTYGPRMNPHEGRAITDFIGDAVGGRSMKAQSGKLVIYGDGSPKRSFQYIDDLVRGVDLVMRKDDFSGPVNLGNPGEITMLELARKIVDIAGTETEIVCENQHPTHDPLERCPDISLAKSALGWEPQVSLEEGLRKTIDYFRELEKPDRRVLVFATTFYPMLGPAEQALFDLARELPETEFHIITTRYARSLPSEEALGNLHIHRVGSGSSTDRFWLPITGARRARALLNQYRFGFMWSVMASYGALAALSVKRHEPGLALFTTLDATELDTPHTIRGAIRRWLSRIVFKSSDSVFFYNDSQKSEAMARSLVGAQALVRAEGSGDFLSQIRGRYIQAFSTRERVLTRPK